MISNFLKNTHKTAKILVLISPILAWFILLVFKANPIYALNNLGTWGENCFTYIHENDLNHTVNYTTIVAIINIIGYVFAFAPSINISIKDKSLKDDISILRNPANPNHKPSSFTSNIDVDFKDLLWLKCIEFLGGIKIIIEPPNWAECTMNNDPWDNTGFVTENLPNNQIVIDLEKAFEDNIVNFKAETIVGISIITNMQNYNEKPIKVIVSSKFDRGIKKSILKFFINIVFNISYKEHKIRIDTKD